MAGKTCVIFAVVLLLFIGRGVDGWFWDDFVLSESKPTNCPHEDETTHVCSVISSANTTCTDTVIECETEDHEEYSESTESDEHHGHGPHHNHHHRHHQCRASITIRRCTVYWCDTFCCDGYKAVEDRNTIKCVNESNAFDCQNGGTPWGRNWCRCPRNFTGRHCEKPICNCQNGGRCEVGANGRPQCMCRPGFVGENCSQSVCRLDCKNGGSCVADGDRQMCVCPHNYVGELCEEDHVNDMRCPATSPKNDFRNCIDECDVNDDCSGDRVCCKEGCSKVCRMPKDAVCEHNGRKYAVGARIPSDDPCSNCTCFSSGTVRCAMQKCPLIHNQCEGGAPVQMRGQCCSTCPDTPPHKPPRFDYCPSRQISLELEEGENYVSLRGLSQRLTASDYKGNKLTVSIDPVYIKHCNCRDQKDNIKEVVAVAVDSEGASTECKFEVKIEDKEPPQFHTCPSDIYVFQDEPVTWQEPQYSDNVGIYQKKCSRMLNGQTYPEGRYLISYSAQDYDRNTGFCDFKVVSFSRDTPNEQLPVGMRQRFHDKKGLHAMVVAGPVIGVVAVIIGVLLLIFCCRHRQQTPSTSQPRSAHHQRYDNNIYSVCGPPAPIKGMKLPQYSLPSNPPAYSSDMKDGEYTYIAPPSYTEIGNTLKDSYENPAYETIPADQVEDAKKEEK